MGHFKGYFEGAKTFLTISGSKKSRPLRNIPRNGSLCSLPKTKKKIIFPNFQNKRCIGIFYVPIDNLIHVSLLLFEIQFFEIRLLLHTKQNVLLGLEETP
jgi:hypothetical protein